MSDRGHLSASLGKPPLRKSRIDTARCPLERCVSGTLVCSLVKWTHPVTKSITAPARRRRDREARSGICVDTTEHRTTAPWPPMPEGISKRTTESW